MSGVEAGDIVRLKSDRGQLMTVGWVAKTEALCLWFLGGKLEAEKIPSDALVCVKLES